MSYIKLNIVDQTRTINDEVHGYFGEAIVAALTAEPETIEELESALARFIKPETEASPFSGFRPGEDLKPYDAGIMVVDLAARIVAAESTYSLPATEFSIRVQSDHVKEDFAVRVQLSDDWVCVHSIPEYEGLRDERREARESLIVLDARRVLFGPPLSEFLVNEAFDAHGTEDEGLIRKIHLKWLTTPRDDLAGKTPRELLLEKRKFIDWDLESRALQLSFTKEYPPPLPTDARAYKYGPFGTHEIVVYYDFFRYLLARSLELAREGISKAAAIERLRELKNEWIKNPNDEFDGREPWFIIELERRRLNMVMSAHEAIIDEDCEICQQMAADFDTPMIWHLDGSGMDDDFEFSFYKTREEYDENQREMEEMHRQMTKEMESGKYRKSFDDFSFGSEKEMPL